jgi:hypothetical protein
LHDRRPKSRAEVALERAVSSVAALVDSPLEGTRIDVGVVEGRPPPTIDVPDDRGTCRYCLAAWTQAGPCADYTFLYRV